MNEKVLESDVVGVFFCVCCVTAVPGCGSPPGPSVRTATAICMRKKAITMLMVATTAMRAVEPSFSLSTTRLRSSVGNLCVVGRLPHVKSKVRVSA